MMENGKESLILTKDNQPDNKKSQNGKCNYQTSMAEENHNKNGKRKSIEYNEV